MLFKFCLSKYFDFDQIKKISQDPFFSISQCLCFHPVFWSILQVVEVLYSLLRRISSIFWRLYKPGKTVLFHRNMSDFRNYCWTYRIEPFWKKKLWSCYIFVCRSVLLIVTNFLQSVEAEKKSWVCPILWEIAEKDAAEHPLLKSQGKMF